VQAVKASRVISAVPPIAAAAAYLVWTHFAAQVTVGDLPPFDLRLYSFAEAQAYLGSLSDRAKAIYRGPLHMADLALMTALAVTLALPVLKRGWVWCLPVVLYLVFDVLENRVVGGLLTHGLHELGEVAVLSVLTGLKFAFLGIAVVMAGWAVWRGAG
jgi:hypothetical protein